MTDPPNVLRKKVKAAVTDSGREVVLREDKPAVSNLLTVFSAASGRTINDLQDHYAGVGYGQFKHDLAEVLVEYLRPLREGYTELIGDKAELARVLRDGAETARAIAAKTLATVYEKIGFLSLGG